MDASSPAPVPPRGLDINQWSEISALGAKFRIYISYTEEGLKGPPPPRSDAAARMMYFFRRGPPRGAEVIANATTCATFDEDSNSILVEVEDEMMISYGSGPTWPRKEFVLFRYSDSEDEGAMGFLSDDEEEVLRWGQYKPTWRLIN